MNLARIGTCLLASLGLACAAPSADTEFDVSPTMLALRVDAQALARDIARGRLTDSRGAAQRIARVSTPPGPDRAVDWPRDFEALRVAGRALDSALESGDRQLAKARFAEIVAVCSACHQRYRPDSGSQLHIEFDP